MTVGLAESLGMGLSKLSPAISETNYFEVIGGFGPQERLFR